MGRKFISAACLLVLAATYAAALAGPLLADHPPDCCAGTLCPMHQRAPSAPATPDCHRPGDTALGARLGNCSMRSCNLPERRAIGFQPYVLPEPLLMTYEAPLAFEVLSMALFFPAPPADIDSPPPRIALV